MFDPSSKAKKAQKSLNVMLYPGPVLLPDISGVLLRFRKPPIMIVADVEKAFHMIGLEISERDVTRFLWVFDPQRPPEGHNLRVPFGVVSAPFILAATKRHHLETRNSPLALELKDNSYADNTLMGAQTYYEALEKASKAKEEFRLANMNLREYFSNDAEIYKRFADDPSQNSTKFLGLKWALELDTLELDSCLAKY